MTDRTLRIIMNGVTGRMGYRQHLVRSILAIRDDGGVELAGRRPDPGRTGAGRPQPRQAGRARRAARRRRVDHRPRRSPRRRQRDDLLRRPGHLRAQEGDPGAIAAGKHIYTEKPIAESVADGLELAEAGAAAGTITGVVHDKLYLPGLVKLKRLVDAGFFGRILSVRGEFGYWVFEGDVHPRAAAELELPRRGRRRDGARHVLPLELRAGEPLRPGRGGDRQGRHPHPGALGRAGQAGTTATADDAAYGIFELGGGIVAQINSSWAVRVDRERAGRVPGRRHPRLRGRRAVRLPDPAAGAHAQAGLESRPARPTRTSAAQWDEVPDNEEFPNGFRAQWEQFLRDVDAGRPHPYDFAAGAAACSWSRPGCGRRRRAAASSSETRTSMSAIDLPRRRRPLADGSAAESPGRRVGRPPAAVRDPGRLRRGPRRGRSVRGQRPRRAGRHRLGRHPGVPRATCSATASAWPRRWTPPSATWAWTGRRRRS